MNSVPASDYSCKGNQLFIRNFTTIVIYNNRFALSSVPVSRRVEMFAVRMRWARTLCIHERTYALTYGRRTATTTPRM